MAQIQPFFPRSVEKRGDQPIQILRLIHQYSPEQVTNVDELESHDEELAARVRAEAKEERKRQKNRERKKKKKEQERAKAAQQQQQQQQQEQQEGGLCKGERRHSSLLE